MNKTQAASFDPRGALARRVLDGSLIAICACLAALASRSFAHGMPVAPVWIADAVSLAFVLKAAANRRAETLAAGVAGVAVANLLTGVPPGLSLCLPGCNALGVAACAAVLLRCTQGAPDLTRQRDLLIFLFAAVASSVFSAALGAALVGLAKDGPVMLDLAVWALADAVGMVMVAPVLLMMADVRAQIRAGRITWLRLWPLVLLAAVTAAVCWQTAYPLLFVILPLWAYAAAELEFVGLTAGSLIVGAIAIGMTAVGHGPVVLLKSDPLHRVVLLQIFIAFSDIVVLQFTAGVIQRRRMNQALERLTREAENRRAGAVEQSRRAQMAEAIAGLGYWRLDLKTGFVDWSSQIYVLFGLPRTAKPQSVRLADMVHPEDRPAAVAGFARIVATGESQHYEGRVITGDGQVHIIRTWATAEFDEAGAVSAVMYVLMDVTDQRRVESELRQARDAAEQAAVVKAEFLANMSHELRTPLTSILGFTALAASEPDMPDTVRHYIDRVSVASKALLTLVNDVLDFSKLEAGEIRLEPRPVDLAALGREVLDLFGEQASAKGLALDLDPADGLPRAVGVDADRLRQVLINLVGNAVKFTAKGGVTLQLSYDAQVERLSASVIDTGPGISADQRSQLFQRFSQVDGSSTRTFGGTGLGLAICKGLIEAMGGEIGVDTELGRGSRFWFEAPAPEVDPAEAAAASVSVSALSLGNRFLVVDDNRANRDLVRAILATLGADIVEASNGIEGVKAAMELPFDVILMDMRMPGLSGEEAVAEIRRGGPNAACPIIAFSASADPGQLEPLRRMGFDGCLPKPFNLTDLIRAIEMALLSSESQGEQESHG